MPQFHDIATFLSMQESGLLLLDARSPDEYDHAHIPGARSLPVLSNEERQAVGTAHARSGQEAAVHTALELVGPHLTALLARARFLYQDHQVRQQTSRRAAPLHSGKSREILIHCWRGGMRSTSLAWLLETGGFHVHILSGGYKTYRAWVRASLALPARTLILGGMTGSGKTDVLHELAALGSQVIDLEGLAGHRGSSFGGVGLPPQPSGESVENELCAKWTRLDPDRPVWLEDEDRRIGAVSLSEDFFSHIRTGRLVLLDVPRKIRVERLAHMYAGAQAHTRSVCTPASGQSAHKAETPQDANQGLRTDLAAAVSRLHARLGDKLTRQCTTDIFAGRFEEAISAVLDYYDKLYARQLSKQTRPLAARISTDQDGPIQIARRLQALEKNMND